MLRAHTRGPWFQPEKTPKPLNAGGHIGSRDTFTVRFFPFPRGVGLRVVLAGLASDS